MADSGLLNDELERLYRLYGDQAKGFRRGLFVLIFAGLAVFALLVVPFLTFRDQVSALQAEEEDLVVKIGDARGIVEATGDALAELRRIQAERYEFTERLRSFDRFQELREGAAEQDAELDNIRSSYVNSPDEGLRAWALGEADRPPVEAVSSTRQLAGRDSRPCAWDRGVRHMGCQVCAEMTQSNSGITRRIAQLTAIGTEQQAALAADLMAIVERSCRWLGGAGPHWQLNEPLVEENLRVGLSLDLHPYDVRIRELHEFLRDSLPKQELAVEQLERTQAALTDRLGVLEANLERIASFRQISTPVGDLPIGVGQLVLLFPVVLAFGFVLVANGYVQMAGVRRALVRLCRMRDAGGEVMDDRHIAAIAPLWLDSQAPLGSRLALWAVILTPVALIAVNLALVARTEALTQLRPDDAAIETAAYVALYALSVLLVLGALRQVSRAARGGTG